MIVGKNKQTHIVKILAYTNITEFTEQMNIWINSGYSRYGNLQVTPHHDYHGYGMQYTQMLIKSETEL